MKVLIAGGAGFIGSTVASACLDSGMTPVILDNLSTGSGHVVASLAAAQADLTEYRRQLGITVPAGEVIFVPSLPVRLTKVAVKTGQTVQGDVGTVTSATMVIQANVTNDDAELLRTGMAARIETPAGSTVAGTVTALREEARLDTGDDGQAAGPDAPPDMGPQSETGTDAVPVLITPKDQRTLSDQATPWSRCPSSWARRRNRCWWFPWPP